MQDMWQAQAAGAEAPSQAASLGAPSPEADAFSPSSGAPGTTPDAGFPWDSGADAGGASSTEETGTHPSSRQASLSGSGSESPLTALDRGLSKASASSSKAPLAGGGRYDGDTGSSAPSPDGSEAGHEDSAGLDPHQRVQGRENQDPGPPQGAIQVRYNHQTRNLSLKEAQTLAQKGLKFDELSPTLDKLRYLAAANNKSLPDMVDALAQSQDAQLYRSLLRECRGNEALAKRLFQAEKDKWNARFAQARQGDAPNPQRERDALNARLADDFIELQAAFPELTAFKQVPPSVVKTAVDKGISLTDAYLRHLHSERRRSEQAKEAQAAAAKASPGSLSAGGDDTVNPAIEAMMAGVWRR